MFGDSRLDMTLGMDEEGRAKHAQKERIKAAKTLQLPNGKGVEMETFLLRAAKDGGTVVEDKERTTAGISMTDKSLFSFAADMSLNSLEFHDIDRSGRDQNPKPQGGI